MNKVLLSGRLVADAEVVGSNSDIVKFRLAVNRPYQNAQGETEADFINVTKFKSPNLAQHLTKGRLIEVEAVLRNNNYENEGKTVYQNDVVADQISFLGPKAS